MKNQPHWRGFTLIELLIAIAVIAILGAIAYPRYSEHVMRTRRAHAAGCVVEMSHVMERYYTTNMKYSGTSLPTPSCVTELASYYTFRFASGEPTNTTYAFEAVPSGAQSSDSCGTLKLNSLGVKSVSGTNYRCWN